MVLKEWRDLWPGGLDTRQYSALNLMANCRDGGLGYNFAECTSCESKQWYASSCGDRHCPNCHGARQARWSRQVCERLPDCPHFHVVFTVPTEFAEFFEMNYRIGADLLFAAATETLKKFQQENWGLEGGFFSVLHTWGSALNWHPHLHVLVSAGGSDSNTGHWRQARDSYSFPVKAMSEVFRAIILRRMEELETESGIDWKPELESVEQRREWRRRLAVKGWNIFSRATLGNTRAVVRYLARYTSRIAISNSRITEVDEKERTVSFTWKDYDDGGKKKKIKVDGRRFIKRFVRHMVPKGLRRIRYYGLLVGRKNRLQKIPGSPQRNIAEKVEESATPECKQCGGQSWDYTQFYVSCVENTSHSGRRKNSFPLWRLNVEGKHKDAGVQQAEEDRPPPVNCG